MSVSIDPDKPDFEETQWITSEDVNVEHLLDVFMMIDTSSDGVWRACAGFIEYFYWHKKRLTILKPKIEGLPDSHNSKPECLFYLSWLVGSVGNHAGRRQLLVHALTIWRERGSDYLVGRTLMELFDVNRATSLYKEEMEQVKEASEIFRRLGDTAELAGCLIILAFLLRFYNQFDAAEEAVLHAISLFPDKGDQFRVCESHRALGNIFRSKGDAEKAIHHFEVAIGIASPFGWHDTLFWTHYELAGLFCGEGRLNDAHAHIVRAKSHAVTGAYNLGLAMELQASVWYDQHRLEEARSEALRAADVYEKFGAAEDVEICRGLLRKIEISSVASGRPGFDCEPVTILVFPTCIDRSGHPP